MKSFWCSLVGSIAAATGVCRPDGVGGDRHLGEGETGGGAISLPAWIHPPECLEDLRHDLYLPLSLLRTRSCLYAREPELLVYREWTGWWDVRVWRFSFSFLPAGRARSVCPAGTKIALHSHVCVCVCPQLLRVR